MDCFIPHGKLVVEGAAQGPLQRLRFVSKDVIDLAGHATAAGNPDWLRTHPVPDRTAPCLQRLLDAGATFVGKVMTDEICCSMSGINPHYGTPLNAAAPDRLCGGSSCGSASAVAAGLADFALGTDTSGSVRLPASYCGVYGYRPTHGRIPLEGVVPLAPSFDTVGIMARDPVVLARVAAIFGSPPGIAASVNARTAASGAGMASSGAGMSASVAGIAASPAGKASSNPADGEPRRIPARLLVAAEAFAFADGDVQQALVPLVRALASRFEHAEMCALYDEDFGGWLRAHVVGIEDEFHRTMQPWIDAEDPQFGEDVGGRMTPHAPPVEPERLAAAREMRAKARERVSGLLTPGAVLCMPTVHCIAPLRSAPQEELTRTEIRSMVLSCVSSLSGVPQVSCPWAVAGGAPVGLSFLAARDADDWLLALVCRLAAT